jgi:hypothetical protein
MLNGLRLKERNGVCPVNIRDGPQQATQEGFNEAVNHEMLSTNAKSVISPSTKTTFLNIINHYRHAHQSQSERPPDPHYDGNSQGKKNTENKKIVVKVWTS